MANIIKFRAALKGLKRYIWREIEIKDTETVETFIYTLLSAFNTTGTHLFSLNYDGQLFEMHQDSSYWDDQFSIEPDKIKLSELNLQSGDVMTLTYDFGADWEFDITVKGFCEIESSKRFSPIIVKGKGKGIIEDIYPWDLQEIIGETNKTGKPFDLIKFDYDDEEEEDEYLDDDESLEENEEDNEAEMKWPWDYREFDLETLNENLQNDIKEFREMYKYM